MGTRPDLAAVLADHLTRGVTPVARAAALGRDVTPPTVRTMFRNVLRYAPLGPLTAAGLCARLPEPDRQALLSNRNLGDEAVVALAHTRLSASDAVTLLSRPLRPETAEAVLAAGERRYRPLTAMLSHTSLTEAGAQLLVDAGLRADQLDVVTAERWQPPAPILTRLRELDERSLAWRFLVRNAWGLDPETAYRHLTWCAPVPAPDADETAVAVACVCEEVPGLAELILDGPVISRAARLGALTGRRTSAREVAELLGSSPPQALIATVALDPAVDAAVRDDAVRALGQRPNPRDGDGDTPLLRAARNLATVYAALPMAAIWAARDSRHLTGMAAGSFRYGAVSLRARARFAAQEYDGPTPDGRVYDVRGFDPDAPLQLATVGSARGLGAWLALRLGDDPDAWLLANRLAENHPGSSTDLVTLVGAAKSA